MDSSSTTRKVSYFCKFFTSPDRKERLRVPVAWSSKFNNRLPCSAYLRNRYGDVWLVTVDCNEETQRYTFEKGWSGFIANNKVQYQDKFVFWYNGQTTFDFKLFGKNNEEKEFIRLPKVEEIQLEDVQAKAKCANMDFHSEEHHSLHAEAVSDDDQTSDPEYHLKSPTGDFFDEEYDVDDEFTDEEVGTKKKTGKKRAPSMKEVDEEAVFRKAGISLPNNPYFVTKRRSNRNEMYIPVEIIRDFELVLPEQIVIRDEMGLEWKAEVKKWKDGRLWLSKGWRAYCKHYKVKTEDWCIVEIVKPQAASENYFIKTRLVPTSALKASRRT